MLAFTSDCTSMFVDVLTRFVQFPLSSREEEIVV